MKYVRLHRCFTDSYLTFKLPKTMEMIDIEELVREKFPCWQIVNASVNNPDKV